MVLDEERAIDDANKVAKRKRETENVPRRNVPRRLSPVINIVTPADSAEVNGSEIVVEYAIRSPSRLPVTGVQAYIDDRPAGEGQKGFIPVSADESQLSLRVPVPPHDATLSLVAFTEFGARERARVRLRWAGSRWECIGR
jgi:hypothetical protein